MKAIHVEEICPAKINLTLHVLGRRGDGFHDLHSVVVQTKFGDRLTVEWDASGSGPDEVRIEGISARIDDCSVLRAFALMREACGMESGKLQAILKKRIPVGAGLGGGSSDAVAALRAVLKLWSAQVPDEALGRIALKIGSDCPLFLRTKPVVMEGQGEQIRSVPQEQIEGLRGRQVLLFKPPFSINTAEAYRRLAAGRYYSSGEVPAGYESWIRSAAPLPELYNDFARLMEFWMPTIPLLLEQLRKKFGLAAQMSGSGSACFAFSLAGEIDMSEVIEEIQNAWGRHAWIAQTHIK
jgi:4-diphosphocytidyl-2-C-methyl-D-erythritol kinase